MGGVCVGGAWPVTSDTDVEGLCSASWPGSLLIYMYDCHFEVWQTIDTSHRFLFAVLGFVLLCIHSCVGRALIAMASTSQTPSLWPKLGQTFFSLLPRFLFLYRKKEIAWSGIELMVFPSSLIPFKRYAFRCLLSPAWAKKHQVPRTKRPFFLLFSFFTFIFSYFSLSL